MTNNIHKLFLVALMTLGSFTVNSFSPALAEVNNNQAKTVTIRGNIVDAKTNAVITDAYIKQVNTLNTVISDTSGNFVMTLEKGADRKILITKDGYESIQADVSNGTDFKLSLYPAVRFENENLPQPHSETAEMFNYSARPISSNFMALYQIRYQAGRVPTITGNSAITYGGLSINEVAVNGQLRFDKWLGSIKVFKSRSPVDVDNFDYKPVYNLDTTQFQLGGGRVFEVSDKMDLYGGLSYLVHFNTPDNRGGDSKPIPYTNSYQDFPQTRQGPGVSGGLGYMISDRIIFNANATLYPIIFTGFDGLSNSNLGYNGMLEAGVGIKVEALPGIYATANYNNQFFFGSLLDDSNFFNIGISLDPFKMASIVQQPSAAAGNNTQTGK